MKNTQWKKVSELKNGTTIAVFDGADVAFDEIASITPIAREQVYDIEIENTHSFVGNDVVAHNTTVFGNINAREGAGISEVFTNAEILKPEIGDIVSVTSQGFIKKAEAGEPLLGTVSADAGIMIGKASATSSPVAFAGKSFINISNENGPIIAGDKIILGSIPGIGAKATTSSMTVGVALESTDFSNATTTIITTTGVEAKIQKIAVFINLGYSKLADEISPPYEGGAGGSLWTMDQATGRIKASYALDMDGKDLLNVRAILSRSGLWSIGDDGKLFVQEIVTEKLGVRSEITLGSSEKRIGITLYDETTGDPYCLKVSGGVTITVSGICGATSPEPPPYQGGETVSTTTPTSDLQSPTVQVVGDNPAIILVGSTYSDNGAIVTDNVDENLGYQTYLNGSLVTQIQLDTSTTTIHSIEYRATDQAGNTGNATRVVNVIE